MDSRARNKARPLFIIGVPRSGTTLLSLLVDQHSQFAIPYESHFIPRLVDQDGNGEGFTNVEKRLSVINDILANSYVKQWDQVVSLNDIDVDACTTLDRIIDQVFSAYARKRGKAFWGDKTPGHLAHVSTLTRLFPESRFVHLVRDGRDVASSLVNKWWGPNDFASGVRYWRDRINVGRQLLSLLPAHQRCEVRFEDLVVDPVVVLRCMFAHFELPFLDDCNEITNGRARALVGARIDKYHSNLLNNPSADQACKWRSNMSKADQALAFEIAGTELMQLGYPAGQQKHWLKPLVKIRHKLSGFWNRRFPGKTR